MKPKDMSSAPLSYLGDAVLELLVREYLVGSGKSNAGDLNREALHFVKATAQREAAERILPLLSEEEAAVFRRGKNAAHHSIPKSASLLEYRIASGFEALFGYLHLEGRAERIRELFHAAYQLDGGERDPE